MKPNKKNALLLARQAIRACDREGFKRSDVALYYVCQQHRLEGAEISRKLERMAEDALIEEDL